MISIVFPAYNEEENVAELHRRIVAVFRDLREPFEIVAVNNASNDATQAELLKLSPIKIVHLANNLGQSSGLDAGIYAASGDIIVTLDADLQNDPADIPKMLTKLREGYDAVVGWRKDRHDSLGRKIFSRGANLISRTVLGLQIHDYACATKMFKKEFLEGVHLYGEMHVFLAAILQYRGARITEMVVAHHDRTAGISKHNFIKGAKDLADLLTVKFLFSTSRPLLIFSVVALASWFIASISIVTAIILKVMTLRNFAQTPLPVVASLFVILGVVLFMGGFLAELILRAYYEGRRQTPYRIKSIIEK